MSASHIRLRRLSRLAARARAEVRSAERGLAAAALEASAARDRSASIATILADTSASIGDGASGALRAGAQLRHLLAPAAAAAVASEARTVREQAQAEQYLKAAAARADSLAERLAEIRRRAGSEAERRAADMTPTARRRT